MNLFSLFIGFLSFTNSEFLKSELDEDLQQTITGNREELIITGLSSGTIWLSYYIYSTDDCSNTAGLVGGLSSDRCEKFSGGSRAMSSCDDSDGVNVVMTFNVYTSDDCSGTTSNTETSLYPAVCTNDSPNHGGYRGFCTNYPDYGIQGEKEYQYETCNGPVASYLAYTPYSCIANGDGTYTEIIYSGCSLATVSSHNNADCSDVSLNYMSYPIVLGTCHNDANTDDLLYFDDDINNGNHWNDKSSMKEYCNSGNSYFNNSNIFFFVAIMTAFLIIIQI